MSEESHSKLTYKPDDGHVEGPKRRYTEGL
jgi:hypothetical protein